MMLRRPRTQSRKKAHTRATAQPPARVPLPPHTHTLIRRLRRDRDVGGYLALLDSHPMQATFAPDELVTLATTVLRHQHSTQSAHAFDAIAHWLHTGHHYDTLILALRAGMHPTELTDHLTGTRPLDPASLELLAALRLP